VYTLHDAYQINGTPLSAPLDPSYQKTYELITGILHDFGSLFPDKMVHMGGDEI